MPQYSIKLNRFDGGLNTKVTPLHGETDESPDCQNVVFTDLGAVATRGGYEAYLSTPAASAVVDGLHSYVQASGSAEMLAWMNSDMFRASANTLVTVPSGQSVFTAGVRVRAINYQNYCFISNGYVGPYKWNGTDLTQMGVTAPSACTVITNGTAGNLNGEYTYTILGVNSNSVQGNYGSACVTATAANEILTLQDIPVFPASAGCQYKQICRNTAAGTSYWVVTQLANSLTTYADNVADASLETAAPTDNFTPTQFTTLFEHLGYIFGASTTGSTPDYLYYSDINEPEIWPAANYLRIGEGDGQAIRGIGVLANSVIVSKNDNKGTGSMYLIYTPDGNPDNWSQTKLNAEAGGIAEGVMTKFANFLMFMNKEGIYNLDDRAIGSVVSDALSYRIEPDIYALADDYVKNCVSINWKNKVWVSVPYGSVTSNNRVYQLDYVRGRSNKERGNQAWSRFTDMELNNFAIHDGALYGGSALGDGKIYTLDTGYNDDGSAIDSYFWTMAIKGEKKHEGNTKVWRYALVNVECTGDWYMSVNYKADFSTTGHAQVYLAPGGAVWDVDQWDVGEWGPALLRKKVRVTFDNMVSKVLQLQFRTNTADQHFKVHDVEIYYNLRGTRG